MKSSYFNNDINYGDIITTSIFNQNPKLIVEFGILDGFSLKIFANHFPDAEIKAFDIFDDFIGNGAKKDIIDKFSTYKNVSIEYGDFYKKYNDLNNIDILHIDIANNGDTYKFAIDHYLPLLNPNGILLLEGGSHERDHIDWMEKYKKPKIHPIIHNLKKRLDLKVQVIGSIPSITLITKNNNFNIHELCLDDFDKGFFELINYFTRHLKKDSKELAQKNIHLFNNDFIKTLVVEYNNKIIGTVKIFLETKIHNNLRKVGHIEDFIIDEKYRKAGLGSHLLRKLVEIGRENDCYKIILECSQDTAYFYEKAGFVKKGTEMTLYYDS